MNSKLSKFYQLTLQERIAKLTEEQFVDDAVAKTLNQPLTAEIADSLVENQIGTFSLPEGVALNFIIDGTDYVIPMVTEEPSVIAACSHAAKLCRTEGGFTTLQNERQMLGQIILQNLPNLEQAVQIINQHEEELKTLAMKAHPSIVKRGGGLIQITPKIINQEFLTLDLTIDTKEAMGANIINTILEALKNKIIELTSGDIVMAILSNYPKQNIVKVKCQVPFSNLAADEMNGKIIAEKIVSATKYANLDIHRCATHNKGIMNGIEAVTLATGNDTRAMAAAIYAYATQNGPMQSLTEWSIIGNHLQGIITLPVPVGSIGGAINVLPQAQANLTILQQPSAKQLASIIASVGLAQNLAALKALVSEGIQRGHMSLHAKSLAIQAGATGDEIDIVSTQLQKSKQMSTSKAREILDELKNK